ncbi:unnamed protein product [Tilletia controversa]|nr:unnamed protein product [Tilletia controversa]
MWKEVKELINLSGFGWDETGKRVTAEEDVWDELVKDVVTPSRKRKRPSAVSAIADIAVALKDLGSQDEGLGDALTELLERDSDVFNEDQLALLGLALADKPRLASVYRSYATRPELRRNFLQKVLDTNP